MNQMEEVKKRYLHSLEQLLDHYSRRAAKETSPLCAEMVRYHFETGGKRLRGLIPSAVFESLGLDGEKILPFGAAVEMIHNATLVHDDLQDGDEVRRGKPTVWKKYSDAQAINCGDAMFQYAYELIGDLELEPKAVLGLVRRAAAATLRVIEGQAQEFVMKDEPAPSVDRYVEVIRGKTSGLFALPVGGALEAAGADKTTVSAFEHAAMDMGMLFQIQDDLLDIFGNKGRDQVATDIAEGKISILVAYAFESAGVDEKKTLSTILRKPRNETSKSDIELAVGLFEKYGAKDKAVKYMRELQTGVEKNSSLKALPRAHQLMLELCDTFLEPLRGVL